MKRILVSQRVDENTSYGERRDALDQRLCRFVLAIGALPVPVPNTLESEDLMTAWFDGASAQGVLLSGGNDIGTTLERDRTELALLRWSTERALPVLGICRGMQFLIVSAGGALAAVENHVGTNHTVEGKIAGEVNSYHRLAAATCPPDYEILSKSPDGVIEAIRHKTLPIEGWMWHPERDPAFSERDLARARELFRP